MRYLLKFCHGIVFGVWDLFRDLREYLQFLERKRMIINIDYELSPELEIPELARRIILAGKPTVVFSNVKGFPGWRMVSNIFRGLDTIRMILGVDRLEDVGERIISLLNKSPPRSFIDKIKSFIDITEIRNYLPKRVGGGDFERNRVDKGFDKVPIPKIWPGDRGRYITYGLVITKDPLRDIYNMGVYRVQVIDGERGAIHWFIHKRAAFSMRNYLSKGSRKIPVAIVVGSDPATMLVGAFPVPYPIDKYFFASIIRGAPLEIVDLGELEVPANSEIVFKGYVYPDQLVDEGPFGDHRGYYDSVTKVPLFKLEETFYRDDPLYYFTVVGRPYMEDTWIGKSVERIFLPFIKFIYPEIIDINLPPEGLFTGGIAIVSIKKIYPGHAKRIMLGLWGLGLLSLVKIIIVVDDDVNVHDLGQVINAIATNTDPFRDTIIINNVPTDELDFVSRERGLGSKLGIDATKKLPEENYGREWPKRVEPDPEVSKRVDELMSKLGI